MKIKNQLITEYEAKRNNQTAVSESSQSTLYSELRMKKLFCFVSLDIEKCQVVFKKESDVAGHKSTGTSRKRELNVYDAISQIIFSDKFREISEGFLTTVEIICI